MVNVIQRCFDDNNDIKHVGSTKNLEGGLNKFFQNIYKLIL